MVRALFSRIKTIHQEYGLAFENHVILYTDKQIIACQIIISQPEMRIKAAGYIVGLNTEIICGQADDVPTVSCHAIFRCRSRWTHKSIGSFYGVPGMALI